MTPSPFNEASTNPITLLIVASDAQLHRDLQAWCQDQGWQSLHCTQATRAMAMANNQPVDVLVGEATGTALDTLSLGKRLRVRFPEIKLVLRAAKPELKATDTKALWIDDLNLRTLQKTLTNLLAAQKAPEPVDVEALLERLAEQDESIAFLEVQLKKLQDENKALKSGQGVHHDDELGDREEYVRLCEEQLSERAHELTVREEELEQREDNLRGLENRLRQLANEYFDREKSQELQNRLSNLVSFEAHVRAS